MAESDAWAGFNAGYGSSSTPFSVGLVGAWLSIGRAELVACLQLARNIFITFSHARQSVATASSTYFCPQKRSQLIFFLRGTFLADFVRRLQSLKWRKLLSRKILFYSLGYLSVPRVWHTDHDGRGENVRYFPRRVHLCRAEPLPGYRQLVLVHPPVNFSRKELKYCTY